MDEFQFVFEDKLYAAPCASQRYAGDVVRLPDGRMLELKCFESYPPQVESVRVVDGPTDVPNPSGYGPGHKGQIWDARLVSDED